MLTKILGTTDLIRVLNVGASILPSSETPNYRHLLELGLASLHAFDGDARQIDGIRNTYGASARIFPHFLYDGEQHKLHVMSASSGLTSILEPDPAALAFFNGFADWGKVVAVQTVPTVRLDDVVELPNIDFAKMDVQGAELTVMMNGQNKLSDCVAIQLEVSFIQLYKKQPSFGQIDLWMRSQGYVPHHFVHIKRWSIAPVVFDSDVRNPGNQLLEADIIYIRDPMRLDTLSFTQLKKLALLSHYAFASLDLCTKVILELVRRREVTDSAAVEYAQQVNRAAVAP